MSRRLAFGMALALIALAACSGGKSDPVEPQEPGAESVALAADEKPVAAGKAFCEEPVHKYGSVVQGEKISHTFTIKNVGDGVLHILSARGG